MKRTFWLAVTLALISPVTAASPLCAAGEGSYTCCKKCKAGKPCGDTCIAKTANCSKPKGCACQG